jgi:thymidylate synthase
MAKIDHTYHKLLIGLKEYGIMYEDPKRKGVFRKQVPYADFFHSMANGFPALTTKKLAWKSVIGELIWFLRGDSYISYLKENNIKIWDKDVAAYEATGMPHNYAGRIYGVQWRKWYSAKPNNIEGLHVFHVDQLARLIENLKESPYNTDHIVTAWNPAELDECALPPCHFGFQIMCYPLKVSDQKLFKKDDSPKGWTINKERSKIGFDLVWDQRSVDTFLGLPFNVASYALLMLILGEITGYTPMNIRGSLRNVHLYDNSFQAVDTQLDRDPNKHSSPTVTLSENFKELINKYNNKEINLSKLFNSIEIKDVIVENYTSYPGIKVEMLERTKN